MLIDAPAMTRDEVALAVADEKAGRHWPGTACWCGLSHGGGEAGLTFAAPPWDEARSGERAG